MDLMEKQRIPSFNRLADLAAEGWSILSDAINLGGRNRRDDGAWDSYAVKQQLLEIVLAQGRSHGLDDPKQFFIRLTLWRMSTDACGSMDMHNSRDPVALEILNYSAASEKSNTRKPQTE